VKRSGRPLVPRAAWEAFWGGYRSGVSVEDAAMAAGVSENAARNWVRQRGGIAPPRMVGSGRFLSLEERIEIQVGVRTGRSVRAIARDLGRSPSTVSRELARNAPLRRRRYRAAAADGRARERARRPKPRKLACHDRLAEEVARGLGRCWSPRQICRRLAVDFPDDPSMRISHEAIYQSLFMQGRGGLRRELASALRSGRALRRPQRRLGQRGERFPGMVMISERPAEAVDRAVPGHWEGDLIIGKDHGSAIGTLVERTTRFVLLLHLPHDHGAQSVHDAVVEAIGDLPAVLRRTLTWDQGAEMARHADIAIDAGIQVFFCDPASPWQRGSNENTNGLLRQYFPKGTDLAVHSADHLRFVADELNGRPRETLGWRNPTEALTDLLASAT
jgi:transposase, IS30 family